MYKFADTHAHVYNEYYDSISDIVNNAKDNGIEVIINSGCDQKSNEEVLKLSNEFFNMYCTLGIHPENVDNFVESDLQFIEDNLGNPKVVAIGEIGLDYYYTKDNKEKQIELFECQLALAQKYNLPVVVHSREATLDTINCLKKYKVTGVIHSFSGSLETAKIYEKMGFLLGVNGVITFKNSNIKEVYKNIDIKNILLETDSPYLSPVPLRGKQNNPSNIKYIADFVSNVYGIDLSQVSNITNQNMRRIFDKIR